jgi:hypothetical protein
MPVIPDILAVVPLGVFTHTRCLDVKYLNVKILTWLKVTTVEYSPKSKYRYLGKDSP